MSAYLQCLSHTPLVGYVNPEPSVKREVDHAIEQARQRIAAFDPDLIFLFAPDHYNGFFYDLMPAFCIGLAAQAIGDFGSAAGPLKIPQEIALQCVEAVMDDGIDVAVSYRMQVDHGFAQPLEYLLGGLDKKEVVPVFINGVAPPMPSFRRARLLGEAVGRFSCTLGRRVLFIASGGLSHEPPVPELATANAHVRDRLCGSGKNLPPDEREARTQRVISAARQFVRDESSLHPLSPAWDQRFMQALAGGNLTVFDEVRNEALSLEAGKSVHESKAWMAAAAAMSVYGTMVVDGMYYRPIREWIAGFGVLGAHIGSDTKTT